MICHNSFQDGILSDDGREYALGCIESGQMDSCFHFIKKKAISAGCRIGWNKVWHGSNLLAWYGRISVTQPIRAVAFEIESNESVWQDCRVRLMQLESGGSSTIDSTGELLSGFGIVNRNIKLLRRLNLDYRERPFVERWSWSGETGVAYLSDGGKFQIWKDLVWVRAIEAVIDREGKIPNLVSDHLIRLNSDESELQFSEFDEDLSKMVETIEMYGCVKLLGDTLIMKSGIGTTPAILYHLYNQEVN